MSLVGYSPWGCKEMDMTEATKYAAQGTQIPHAALCSQKNKKSYYCRYPNITDKETQAQGSQVNYPKWDGLR